MAVWLSRPLSGRSCVLGWCLATSVFIGLVAFFGGPALNDTYQSAFSTWAIAHGQLSCAFPSNFRMIAPFYPLLSGGIAAANHVGSAVPFPSSAAMGPHCQTAFRSINSWSVKSGGLDGTYKVAYVGWGVLMVGIITFLRASGRGRTRWEPTTLLLAAFLPTCWMCIEASFHPEDLIAMGLGLTALAAARRKAWVAAGALATLAVLSQQFALLIAAPLLVLVPASKRLAYLVGASCTLALVAGPFVVTRSGGAIQAILLGSGNTGGIGGTVVWELGLHGTSLLLLSRVLPVGLSLAVAWWTTRRMGSAALEPPVLVALVAVSLSLRLIFEQQLFGYYFMALSVSLLLLDVIRGRIRSSLIAWLATVSMVYLLGSTALDLLPRPWEPVLRDLIPCAVILFAAFVIVRQMTRTGPGWTLIVWVTLIGGALISWDESNFLAYHPPTWVLQICLVPFGIVLAAGPLFAEVRRHSADAALRRQRILSAHPGLRQSIDLRPLRTRRLICTSESSQR